ncbi:hypothetical protein C486_17395 [Natrinema gari JCM 14663]|uniref:Uncharacterized protein n=1 Tax=Natrinema gari JCM 14663 TaxID=1230459 RepID=L9YSP6_9EURY|nr:hypothetical protein C486_17395 [Natrinema gari JCM 14663]
MFEDNLVTRRKILAAGSTGIIAGLAGCQWVRREPEIEASIENAEAYQLEPDRLVAVTELSKPEGSELRVRIRWEVTNDEYTQAVIRDSILDEEASTQSVSILMNSPTEIDTESVTRSELKLIRNGEPDSSWVPAPFSSQ